MPYRLQRSLFIPRPRKDIFAFFADAANLERITPSSLRFHIVTPQPITMQPGARIDYELRLHGIRFRWRSLIETYEPPCSFTDIQLTGPYRRWHHRHEFIEVQGGTEMRDTVDYELPLGPLGAFAHFLFVRRSLNRIFNYRNTTITEIFTS